MRGVKFTKSMPFFSKTNLIFICIVNNSMSTQQNDIFIGKNAFVHTMFFPIKKKLVLCRHTIIYYKQGSITSWTRQTKWYRGYRWYLVNRNGWNWVQSYVHINMCSYFQKEYNLHITYILQKESSNKSSSWFLKDF